MGQIDLFGRIQNVCRLLFLVRSLWTAGTEKLGSFERPFQLELHKVQQVHHVVLQGDVSALFITLLEATYSLALLYCLTHFTSD